MLLAAFEPGREMAIANFFLAIFCLFSVGLPLLLITRGDKTEANRDFLAATVNPWSQIGKRIELTPVVVSEITPSIEEQPKLEVISTNNDESISESENVFSIESKSPAQPEEPPAQLLETKDEVLAA